MTALSKKDNNEHVNRTPPDYPNSATWCDSDNFDAWLDSWGIQENTDSASLSDVGDAKLNLCVEAVTYAWLITDLHMHSFA